MKKIPFALFLSLYTTLLLAQEDRRNTTVTITANEGRWYSTPWVWIAGAAFIILLLVLLTGRKRAE